MLLEQLSFSWFSGQYNYWEYRIKMYIAFIALDFLTLLLRCIPSSLAENTDMDLTVVYGSYCFVIFVVFCGG